MKTHNLLLSISTLLLFFFYHLPSVEAQVNPNSKAFISTIDSLFADKSDRKNPGAAVIVLKGKDVLFSKSYGASNLPFERPFDENTQFPLSNFTDQLVAFSILQLEKKQDIKLSDPVHTYLPKLGFSNDISIAHLLNHSSGFPVVGSIRLMAGWNYTDPFYQNDFLNLTKKFTKDSKPDTHIQHNHTGIKILQMVVEKVSNMDFSKYVTANIFQPLGMTNSFVKNENFTENKNTSIGYEKTDVGYQRTAATELALICPMTYSTQADFEKWMLNIQTKKFEKSIIEQMDQALSMNGEAQKRANRAFCIGQHQYYKFLGEDEFYLMDINNGHSWKWIRLQQSDLSIMAIGNSSTYIGNKVNAIARLLVPPTPPSSDTETAQPKSVKIAKKDLQTYTGFYWDSDYLFAAEVSIKDGGLYYTDLDNGWNFPLTPHTKLLFEEPNKVKVAFKNLSTQPKLTLILPNGSKYYANKYDPKILTVKDYSKYTGIYSSDKVHAFLKVVVEDNKLILKRSKKPDLELKPIGKNKFRAAEVDFRLIEFKADAQQSIFQMTISNTVVKNVAFRKL